LKNYSTQPTDDNILEMFKNDAAGRNGETKRFLELLNNINISCVIALNGDWGSGKTFFVKQAKLILDACNGNPKLQIPMELKEKVKQC